MSSLLMMFLSLGGFLLLQLDLASGLKCYTCKADMTRPLVPANNGDPSFYKGDICIARDGKSVLDANVKGTTDCPDGQFCGTSYDWYELQVDVTVPINRTITFSRGCFAPLDNGVMNGGRNWNITNTVDKSIIGNVSIVGKNFSSTYRAMCKNADYCNAHPLGGIYMGILDGSGYTAPSHGAQLVAAILPLTFAFLALLLAK